MEQDNLYGKTAILMMENGRMGKKMVKDNIILLMEINIQVNIKMEKNKVLVF